MCFEYDEHADVFDSRTVKCRKSHPCEGCSRKINRGESAELCSGLFEGHWFRYYVCTNCQRLIVSIAAKELKEGCPWNTAWIAPQDLQEYLYERYERYEDDEDAERLEILGMRTVDDCRRYVGCLWETMKSVSTDEYYRKLVLLDA